MKLRIFLRLFISTVFVFNLIQYGLAQKPNLGNRPTQQRTAMSVKEEKELSVMMNNSPSAILLNAVHIEVSDKTAFPQKALTAFGGKKMHLIKFSGPIKPEWYKMMTDAGVEVVDYIPNYAYLVYGDYSSLQRLNNSTNVSNSPVIWDGDYLSDYKLQPGLYKMGANGQPDKSVVVYNRFTVQLYADVSANSQTRSFLNLAKTLGTTNHEQGISHYINITVSLSHSDLIRLSREFPDVISIHPYVEPRKNDERQNIIMTGQLTGNAPTPGNYLTWLGTKGFTQAQFDASNFSVNVSDDGLDAGVVGTTLQTTTHFGLYRSGDVTLASRVAFIHKQGTATDADSRGVAGHGTLNSHIVGGFVPDALLAATSIHKDASNFRYGLGIAPFVKVGNSVFFTTAGFFTNPNFTTTESQAYQAGARISTNSWGANVGGAYTADAQAYDFLVRDAQPASSPFPAAGNQEMVIFFSAGNSGSGANTIGAPGTGKNIISVGASENVHAFGAPDQCGISDAGADNANDIISFSSRGPCDDGRIKPDIVAPGTHITGGNWLAAVAAPSPITATGTANPLFNATGVCAGPGTSNHFPTTQQWYTASSGTSHSTPAVAGFGALIRQTFINRGFPAPSPAMTKAMILSGASHMNGVGANDNLFSNNQGMGLTNMERTFTSLDNPHIRRDQIAGDMFTASGQQRVFAGNVASGAQPIRITLAYTDAPGPTTGNAFVNNLDLEVTVGGNTYKGNVFTGANSVTGGIADTRNNVESVFLPAGTTGPITVRVRATNIAGDGVPNTGGALDQDFALFVSNINEAPIALPSGTTATLVTESCLPANGVIDPGETVTVSLCVENSGTTATTNLVGTLQATGGVTAPSAAQNYGAIAPSANACRNFTFTASGTCGNTITLTMQLQDGATNHGNAVYTFTMGTPVTLPGAQNFDGVAAPAIPAGWVSTVTGSGTNWVTTTTPPAAAPSAPNVATTPGFATVGSAGFESVTYNVSASGGQLSFMLNHNLERGSSGTKFDGIILEISINGGAYQNITTAGGTFVVGGYDAGLISTCCSNPIAGEQAWSGNSAGFFLVTVTLPAAANGQPVKFRWRTGYDSSVISAGAWIDNVSVQSGFNCCTAPSVTINQAVAQADPTSSSPINFTVVFSEPVTGFTNTDISFAGSTAGGTLVANITGAGPTYNVAVSGMTTSGTVVASIPANSATGTVNVTGNSASTSVDNTVTYNVPPPTGCTPSPDQTFTNNTPLAIPTGPAVVTSTIVVAGAPTYLYDLNVITNIVHSFAADMDITITSPAGTVVTLTTDNGAGNDDVFNGTIWDDKANPGGTVPYTTNNGLTTDHAYVNLTTATPLAPEEPLGAFIGENPNGTWTITISDDLAGDGGTLNSWSLVMNGFALAPIISNTSVTNSTPLAIPTGPAVVTSTITVSGAGTLLHDLNLTTFLTHTFAADLDITLTSPAGTVVTLTTDNGAGNDNVFNGTVWDDDANPAGQVPYTTNNGMATDHAYVNLTTATTLAPEEALAAFIGEDPNGTWTITISDDLTGDGGSLDSWTLDIQTATCCVTPIVNPVTNQTLCNNAATTAVNFTLTPVTATVDWVNDTPSIGLAASGTGNIASFNAINTGNAPVVATITATPKLAGCPDGTPITFTITVNPTPNAVATPASQTVCSNNPIATIALTGNVAGTTFNWTRNNTGTVTGIAANGSGNISGTLVNTTNAPVTVTFTITPTANGCTGTAITATVLVNPTPNAVATPASQTICSNTAITTIALTGNVAGTTFNWTRNNTATVTGIAANGSGNISGSLVNTTAAPVTVTFTITPTANGCPGTAITATVLVNPTPIAVATPATQTICSNTAIAPIVLTSTTAGTTFAWTRDNTAAVTGIAASGSGNITGTLVNATTSAQTVTFTITPTANGCVGPSITATVIVQAPLTITCPANVSVTTPVGSCVAVVNYTPTITGTPAPTVTYTFTGATTGSGSGNGSGSSFNIGVTTVTVTATNICSTVSCSFTITVADAQLPVITTQPVNRTACVGTNATFSVVAVTSPNPGGPLAYQWQSWNGTTWVDVAGATANSHTVNSVTLAMNTNTFRCRVTGLCTTIFSGPGTLFVNPLPSISLNANPAISVLPAQSTSITATVSPTGGSFVWTRNGTTVSGVTGATVGPLTVDNLGSYQAVYTDPNGCQITSSAIAITALASENVWIYPNPNNGTFNVRYFNQTGEQVTIRVFNSIGQLVHQQATATTTPYSLTTINLPVTTSGGVYVVKVVAASGIERAAKKIIIGRK